MGGGVCGSVCETWTRLPVWAGSLAWVGAHGPYMAAPVPAAVVSGLVSLVVTNSSLTLCFLFSGLATSTPTV